MERRRVLSLLMCIGIVGYFTVPNVANYIVHAGGGNAMLTKVNALVVGGSSAAASTGIAAGGMVADAMGDAYRHISTDKAGGEENDYLKDKLKG